MNKKIVAPILLLLVITTLGVIVFKSYQSRDTFEAPEVVPVPVVTGLIGSEKKAFFSDPDVKRILEDNYNIKVEFETVGSRRISTDGGARGTLDNYDFAFPAGTPAAENIKENYDIQASYRVFFTPMAIASWQPVVNVLENNNIVNKENGYYAVLDMQQLLSLMDTQTRWRDLPNNQDFDIGRQILINSTDIRSSNSAAMYLSLASYLSNDNQIVSNQAQSIDIVPKVLPLFANQGFLAGSSATPFQDYLIKGMGNSPMVMIYESQYLYEASQGNGTIRDDMVLLYPEPTIFTQHTLLAMDDKGKRLGEALVNDIELQKLAIKHGYRSNNASLVSEFDQNLKAHGLENVPANLTEVIDTPSYDVLEGMIVDIENRLDH